MLFADKAVICTNPELSSIKDSDKMIGFISSKSRRALEEREPVKQSLLVTRYNPARAQSSEMINIKDMLELLGLPLLGAIPESNDVLNRFFFLFLFVFFIYYFFFIFFIFFYLFLFIFRKSFYVLFIYFFMFIF